MRHVAAALSLILLAAILASGAPATAGPGGVFLYVHDNSADNRVFAFRFDRGGTLTGLAGSPFSSGDTGTGCGGPCETMAYSPRRKLLFTTGSNGISVFRVGSDGGLSLVSGSPFGGVEVFGVAVVKRKGRDFVYASEERQDRVRAFELQPDASLVPLFPATFTAGDGPLGTIAVKKLLFVANENRVGTSTSISGYEVQADGTLIDAPGNPFFVADAFVFSVFADRRGKLLYGPDCDNGRIFGFSIDRATAALTGLPGSPFASGTDALCAGLAIGKKPLLFGLDESASGVNDVRAFLRDRDGTLAPLGGVQSSGVDRAEVGALDPTGRFLVIASAGSDTLRTFSVDAATGAIVPVDTAPLPADEDVNALLFVRR
jgi:6-phosphogluconolactonase (cycloisomerase 2 family)